MRGLYSELNIFGMVAAQSALSECANWRVELLNYLRANRALLLTTLVQFEDFKITIPEATYLLWIDGREFCQKYKIDNLQRFFEQAGVGLSDGNDFGNPNFVRLNFGTSRVTLQQAIERMLTAIQSKINSN
jgi:cystathionine beta-lyase